MGKRTTLPDDQGWYWMNYDGAWSMAFVDTNRELVLIVDGDDPAMWDPVVKSFTDNFDGVEWYGKIECPGGDFGGITVIAEEDTHDDAEHNGKAIVIKHADFSHCRDERHRASITTVGIYDRDEAMAIFDDQSKG